MGADQQYDSTVDEAFKNAGLRKSLQTLMSHRCEIHGVHHPLQRRVLALSGPSNVLFRMTHIQRRCLRLVYGASKALFLQIRPVPRELTLRQSPDDIFGQFEVDGTTIIDGFTERGFWDQAVIRRQHMTASGGERPVFVQHATRDLLLEQTRLHILCRNLVPSAALLGPSRITL